MIMTPSRLLSSLCLTAAIASGASAQTAPETLTIKGGSQGGSWYTISAAMTQIFAGEGVTANAELGNGLSNVMVIGQGEADVAITFASVPPAAAKGVDPFPAPMDNIRAIAMLSPSAMQLIVSEDSGIDSYADIAGKSIATSTVGSSTEDLFALTRGALGLSDDDLTLSRGNVNFDIDAVKDRSADGLFVLTAAPTGSFIDLFSSNDVKLVPVDEALATKLNEANAGYVASVIPAGTYEGQDEDVASVSTSTMIVVNADMPEEEAYFIAKTLVEHIADLQASHNSLASITPETMGSFSGAEPHPGALRYFTEAGLIN
ncbi:TAXI family TRAP transporter solute-binding subunit [Salipiger sp. PrR002]|uniref:TAXI family TRAP transporter solute-binding subunit n=1 Tax=Salipiger sp. PrR002 TaxID=2706489 RepID=UPI0013B7E29F|nr:TAXI family TRAP transporter solute-binding subunit [Salipiger sp. PrR002]NDW01764.1 TAXI family TRAP transporter solute-binding subunit [Salipiger sp. PrR002]NDW57799.1 TAXI family TRAP transporter solute-binding subunit [Salipiger sp. PrR004]